MDSPKVLQCQVAECAYNMDNTCHALAVTIGDAMKPRCDTFCRCSEKGGDPTSIAVVGACKMASCMYNKSLECSATSISVGFMEKDIDCLTFRLK
jgi:hypothetical protein